MATILDLEGVQSVDKEDIVALKQKITDVQLGRLDEERFKHYRLTRGVYGQRQLGVQMFRTKIPFGRLATQQLEALAAVSEQYSNGKLHLTTRQNIQLHYVKLGDAPHIWTALSKVGVTAMGACGNTVRNITASADAGVHPQELFDVSPYVQALFEYFLRHPICQDMGRKIKIAFSATDEDSAFVYFHDFGFIPRIKNGKRGFKVLLGGGLGAQAMIAPVVYEFLEENKIIPFVEASIRVFDRHGEREKRMKARMKFFIKKWGVEHFLNLVAEEKKGLPKQTVPIEIVGDWQPRSPKIPTRIPEITLDNRAAFELWKSTNVFEQKQAGNYGVWLKVRLGDISAEKARALAVVIREYAADELRLTVNQGILLKYVPAVLLPHLYQALKELDLADAGFGSIVDITACPGTDTCNLGVSNSTGLAKKLEEVLVENYQHLIGYRGIQIKISGCMNACGQHMAANIGFHGSSLKVGKETLPAMQVVLGGGVAPDGQGFIAEKIIKLPTKRIPIALTWLLDDYENHQEEGAYFNDYVRRQGKIYFYNLLKPLGTKEDLHATDFWDWGQEEKYQKAIGVGECAGVAFDLVTTIIRDAEEKVQLAEKAASKALWGDSTYLSYGAFVIAAKGLLLSKNIKCNTHIGIINDFQEHFITTQLFSFTNDFATTVLAFKQQEPTETIAKNYGQQAAEFVQAVVHYRAKELEQDSLVLSQHYKA